MKKIYVITGREMVKPIVDKELCISCGNCVELCPDVFQFDENEKAGVVCDDCCGDKCDCQEAAESCPTDAISLQD